MRRLLLAGMLTVTLGGCVITTGGPVPVSTQVSAEQGKGTQEVEAGQDKGTLEVEAGVLKGRVVGADGRPIQGAEIAADNQLLYNSNLIVSTDADGFYRVDTDVAATFHVTASMKIDFNGKKYAIDLAPEDDTSFAGPTGAVRNFTWKLTGERPDGLGHYGSSVLFYLDNVDPQNPEVYLEDENVEVTLTPEGPLADGSAGQTITRRAIRTPDGSGLVDVPLGRYRISANYQGRPLQVGPRNSGQYAAEVVADFAQHINAVYWIELEMKL
ncbi:carboxypeptidase-like regulatory domain-containing protein [Nonomuraea sp. NPDC049714]|uniref:carboxypeptidase-like regulatory domain-containing protein n=1 Tax=Nonomuraea sp. NPDC049714 TaxID=3364357 RepID=UPI0037BC90ED